MTKVETDIRKKDYMLDEIEKSWEDFFDNFGWKRLFLLLENIEEDNFLPNKKDVFRIFRETSVNEIKVVIIGQDPYHQKGIADGFSFSTRQEKTPASLRNIFFELEKDLGVKATKNNLDSWVKQGVFLFNTCLTVKENEPLSHKNHWFEFSKILISYIERKREDLVWVFWGNNAKLFRDICNIKSACIINSSHPSPFSAGFGFFNSKPFSKVNNFLKKKNRKEISWET